MSENNEIVPAPRPPAPEVPTHAMAHTPPVVSPYGAVTVPQVVYAINPYRNTTCITALVLGLATFVTFGFTAIPAVIVGHIGLTQCKAGTANQKGMALSGMILGYLAVAGWLFWWLLFMVGLSQSGSTS